MGDMVDLVNDDNPDVPSDEDVLLQKWCEEFGTENITSSPLRVAGVSFKQDNVKHCEVGNIVHLVPEPQNRFDQHAIRVIAETEKAKHHVGYVPKDCCLTVKQAIGRPDYKGCRIAKMGKPQGSKHVGIQLALLFEKDPPDLYAPFGSQK